MKIFETSKISLLDRFTIAHEPITSIDLMERAAFSAYNWLEEQLHPAKVVVFCGPGNNGGDGLAVARLLKEGGCTALQVYCTNKAEELSADAQINYTRLLQAGVQVHVLNGELPAIPKDALLVDALLGAGLNRPLKGYLARLVQHINAQHVVVVSIDLPSGLMGEDNSHNLPENIIKATYTLTFQCPKLSFLLADCAWLVGQWVVLPIGLHPEALKQTASSYYYMESQDVAGLLRIRPRFAHKGTFGKALLVAGSYGMMGAAVLAAKACFRAGVGWLKVHCPAKGLDVLQYTVPEVIVEADEHEKIFSKSYGVADYTAVGVGPGIGQEFETQYALKELLQATNAPMVIDADALNILSKHPDWLPFVPTMSLLTPHRREMERLIGNAVESDYHLLLRQQEFARQHGLIVILKGANTSIALPDGRVFFNSTGNPGMAKAGSGDVLTGVLLSLLSQGYAPDEAAQLGVFLHGMAGDLVAEQLGQEALMPSDLVDGIGSAYQRLRE